MIPRGRKSLSPESVCPKLGTSRPNSATEDRRSVCRSGTDQSIVHLGLDLTTAVVFASDDCPCMWSDQIHARNSGDMIDSRSPRKYRPVATPSELYL